jgi:hypothetical protein
MGPFQYLLPDGGSPVEDLLRCGGDDLAVLGHELSALHEGDELGMDTLGDLADLLVDLDVPPLAE